MIQKTTVMVNDNYKNLTDKKFEVFDKIKGGLSRESVNIKGTYYFIKGLLEPSYNHPTHEMEFTFLGKAFKLKSELFPFNNQLYFTTVIRIDGEEKPSYREIDSLNFILKFEEEYYNLYFEKGDTTEMESKDNKHWGEAYCKRLIEFLHSEENLIIKKVNNSDQVAT